ncbi:hypothetical protein N7522_010097 [Penicillium canescens]|nr:hypothetical protein N7522_010097 [Penicillium canescens]
MLAWDNSTVCVDLNKILPISSLRHQRLLDYVFQSYPKAGPFFTVKDFNDWFSYLPQAFFLLRRNTTTPTGLCYRTVESLNLPIATSTEGTSLSLPANQLESCLSWTGDKRDGIQTLGSLYTCWYEDKWRRDWVDNFLSPRLREFEVFAEYTMAMGSV